jgi:hypothetical protein
MVFNGNISFIVADTGFTSFSYEKKRTFWGHLGCDLMVVGFTTTYAISAYHH